MRSGRRSTRQVARIGALALLVVALGAQAAWAVDDEVGATGTLVGGNLAVGGQTVPQTMGAVGNPFLFVTDPALQSTGVRIFDVPGTFEAFDQQGGNVYALRNFANGLSDVFAFSPSGAPVIGCDGDGMSDALSGFFGGLFASDEFIFLFGHTGGSDAAKLVLRLDLACQPAPGGGFDANGRMTLNPTNGFDIYSAGEYDTLGAIGIVVLVGGEGPDGEIDLFDEDGIPITAFDGDGSLTIDLSGTVGIQDVELLENGNGMLDALDRVVFGGQHSADALLGVTDGTGAPPGGTWCGTTGTDAIVQIFDIAPALSNFVDGLAIGGSVLFAGGTIITPQQVDSQVNAFGLADLCDLSTPSTQSWVRVLDGVQANNNDVGALVPSGNGVFVIGTLDNPQTQSFDAYIAGVFDQALQRQRVRVIELLSTGGPGPGPGPGGPGSGGGTPGGNLPGDFDLDGQVDAADFVLWRRAQLSPDGLRVRIQTPDGVPEADSVEAYNVWRANFGRGSAAQRRAGVVFARNRTTLRGGQSKRVRVRLTKAGKRLVRRYDGRRLRARLLLRITYRPASGGPVQRRTFRQAVRLRVVKPRRRG